MPSASLSLDDCPHRVDLMLLSLIPSMGMSQPASQTTMSQFRAEKRNLPPSRHLTAVLAGIKAFVEDSKRVARCLHVTDTCENENVATRNYKAGFLSATLTESKTKEPHNSLVCATLSKAVKTCRQSEFTFQHANQNPTQNPKCCKNPCNE